MSQNDDNEFEEMVRQYARQLWSEAALGGSIALVGRERDGYFETKESIFIIEATTSKKKDKILSDGSKTHRYIVDHRNSTYKPIAGWLITKFEPTVEQKDAAKKYPTVRLLSFNQFKSLLFDGRSYIECRKSYPFGSVRDVKTNSFDLKNSVYIPLDYEIDGAIKNIDALKDDASEFQRVILTGEYGSGKSISLREIFNFQSGEYLRNNSNRFPLYLNLRDHLGQKKTVGALEHHAREIGYPGNPSDIVRAWRTGHCNLILDGFDELGTAGWGGSLNKVRQHRESAMTLVRNFISETHSTSRIIVSGRENFFNNDSELRTAIGAGVDFYFARVADLSADQTRKLLIQYGYFDEPPDWLPSRPLLVSYLAAEKILPTAAQDQGVTSAAVGWNRLLDVISAREASQDDRLDAQSVRKIIERLASRARNSNDGRGLLDISYINSVFRDETGFTPDELAQQFLLRIPGLTPAGGDDGSRQFVDVDLCDAARSGDIVRYLDDPYSPTWSFMADFLAPGGQLCIEMVAAHIRQTDRKPKFIATAINMASDAGFHQSSLDLYNAMIRSFSGPVYDSIRVLSAFDSQINFYPADCQTPNAHFSHCLFSTVTFDPSIAPELLPTFLECETAEMSGFTHLRDVPDRIKGLKADELVDEISTNKQLFDATLPSGMKALNSSLRKLFLQSGGGRREDAFYRGGVAVDVQRLLPDVLRLIQRYDFASPERRRGRTVWVPNWRVSDRARRIIASPQSSDDPLAEDVRRL